MDDVKQILWELYKEDAEFGRHHERQRTAMTTIILAISAGISGFLTFDSSLSLQDLPLSIFLVILGIFGATFSAKYHERSCLHLHRARCYRKELNDLLGKNLILNLKQVADGEHRKAFPRLINSKINKSWVLLHLLISVLGLFLSAIIART